MKKYQNIQMKQEMKAINRLHFEQFGLVSLYDTSTILDYIIPNPFYTYILDIRYLTT